MVTVDELIRGVNIVGECASSLPGIRFISVDVVKRADGVDRVVEIGDGQVSDLVGRTAARFAKGCTSPVNVQITNSDEYAAFWRS